MELLTAIFVFVIIPATVFSFEISPVVVKIPQGQLQGKIARSQNGREYVAFLNIPYAEAGRFQAPTLASKWQGIFLATEDGPECAYLTWYARKQIGTEDCLSLNIYTPANLKSLQTSEHSRFPRRANSNGYSKVGSIDMNYFLNEEEGVLPGNGPTGRSKNSNVGAKNSNSKTGAKNKIMPKPKPKELLPVVVYLHGGVFTLSSRNNFLDPYMMNDNIVYVTIKYRVGPFGFLSTGDEVIPGNFGLKDQNMALQWVQSNIANFGGDPKNVVLVGNGAGAVSVNFHMLSPKSAGLFHSAIMHSGCSLVPWALTKNPHFSAHKLGQVVKCPSKNSGNLLSCLLKKTTTEIMDGMKLLLGSGPHPFAPYAPVIEPNFPGAFIAEHPYVSMHKPTGIVNRVPVLVGVTENEDIFKRVAYIAAHPAMQDQMNKNWKKIFPVMFEYNQYYTNFSEAVQEKISKKIKHFYFGNRPVNEHNHESLKRALADRLLNYGMKKMITLLSQQTPVYAYLIDSNPGGEPGKNHVNVDAAMDGSPNIVSNSIKVVTDFLRKNSADEFLTRTIALMASFARDKKPTALWGSQSNWNPVEVVSSVHEPIQYFRIGQDTSMVAEPFTHGVEFWSKALKDALKEMHDKAQKKSHGHHHKNRHHH